MTTDAPLTVVLTGSILSCEPSYVILLVFGQLSQMCVYLVHRRGHAFKVRSKVKRGANTRRINWNVLLWHPWPLMVKRAST